MSAHEQKYCPRCHSLFECKVGSILLCQCSKVSLDDRTQAYLNKNYEDCLCASCMKEIKLILKNTIMNEER